MGDAPSFDGRSEYRQSPARRKIQMTGGSTFTVSLPKSWAQEHNLERGMGVELYPRGDWVAVTLADTDRSRRQLVLDADRHTAAIARTVVAAYVTGCEEIHVEHIATTEQRRAIREAITGLVGIEIQEETESTIVARTMLDIGDLSPVQTLKQIELTALTMHQQAVEATIMTDHELANTVRSQDDSVDRLFALVCRVFQRSLVDVGVPMQENGLTTFEYYTAGRQLERIGDHAESIAEVALRLDGPPPDDICADIEELAEACRELIRRALHELLEERDPMEFHEIITDAQDTIEVAERLHRSVYEFPDGDVYALGSVIDSLIRSVEYGVNIAEAGLQVRLRDSPRKPTSEAP